MAKRKRKRGCIQRHMITDSVFGKDLDSIELLSICWWEVENCWLSTYYKLDGPSLSVMESLCEIVRVVPHSSRIPREPRAFSTRVISYSILHCVSFTNHGNCASSTTHAIMPVHGQTREIPINGAEQASVEYNKGMSNYVSA